MARYSVGRCCYYYFMRSIIQGALIGVLVGVAVVFGGRFLGVFPSAAAPAPVTPAPAPAVAPAPAAPIVSNPVARVEESPLNPVFPEPRLWVRGYAVRGSQLNVFLSDGTVLMEGIEELEQVSRTYIKLAGKRYPIRASGKWTEGEGKNDRQASPVAAGVSSPVADTVQVASAVPAVPKEESGGTGSSWVTGKDGVQRLRVPERLGK